MIFCQKAQSIEFQKSCPDRQHQHTSVKALISLSTHTLSVIPVIAFFCQAALNDPFPFGYSMGNFGAITAFCQTSAYQPWTPSAQLAGIRGFGFGLAGTDYFDDMDNFTGDNIRQAGAGAWIASEKITLKAAWLNFNALGFYMEQEGLFSIGTSLIPFVSAGIDLSGTMAGLTKEKTDRQTAAFMGVSFLVPGKYAGASVSLQNILIKRAHTTGFIKPMAVTTGIYTMPHKFGAQGVLVVIEPQQELRIRFYAAQEYWIADKIGLGAALSVNPVMAGFTCTAAIRKTSVFFSLTHHPILGWSRGAGSLWHCRFSEKSDAVSHKTLAPH